MAWPLLYVAGVNAVESTWQSKVHGIIDHLADGLADGQEAKLRQRVRVLADNLLRDVLRAVCGSTAREIAAAISALEETRDERAALLREAAKTRPRVSSKRANSAVARATHNAPAQERRGRNEQARDVYAAPPAAHAPDPFDITMPSELLASTDDGSKAPRLDGASATAPVSAVSAHREPRPLPRLLSEPESVPVAATPDEAGAASERRPKVVLREGERLLKGTGSGVVIRRERRKP